MGLSRRDFLTVLGVSAALPIGLSGCEKLGWPIGKEQASASGEPPENVTIGYQYGLGYGAMPALRQSGVLGEKVKWKTVNSGKILREARDIQIAGVGLGAFLLGKDQKEWSMLMPLSSTNPRLMVMDPNIRSLEDLLKAEGKFGVPSLEATQACVLREKGIKMNVNAEEMNFRLLAVGHPDAMKKLKAKELVAHFAIMPYDSEEEADGAHSILSVSDVIGGVPPFAVVAVRDDFYARHPSFCREFGRQIAATQKAMINNPSEMAKLIGRDDDYTKFSNSQIEDWLKSPNISFNPGLNHLVDVARMMEEQGIIKKTIKSADEVMLKGLPELKV